MSDQIHHLRVVLAVVPTVDVGEGEGNGDIQNATECMCYTV